MGVRSGEVGDLPGAISRTPRVEAELPRGQSAQANLRRGRRQIDHSLFRCGAAGRRFKEKEGTKICKSVSRFEPLSWNRLSFRYNSRQANLNLFTCQSLSPSRCQSLS